MTAPRPRKIAIYPSLGPLDMTATVDHVRKSNDANTYTASGQNLPAETAARIAADLALNTAITNEAATRATADTNETNARVAADSALNTAITNEATTRGNADTTLNTAITNEATTRASADTAEAGARVAGDTAAMFASFDLSGLPTSNPGGGRPWLSSGNIRVGP